MGVASCSHLEPGSPWSSELLGSSAKKFRVFHGRISEINDGGDNNSCDIRSNVPLSVPPPLPTTICDLNQVANLFAACACPECGSPSVQLVCNDEKKMGMAVFLRVLCTNCEAVIAAGYTSATLPGDNNAFEITRRTVTASLLCGFGARKLNKFCEYLNLPGLSCETFRTHCEAVFELTPPTENTACRTRSAGCL